MSYLRECLFVHAATPEGGKLLEEHSLLQSAVWQYVESPQHCLTPVDEANFIGNGSFSYVYNFNDELALKVSNPETVDTALLQYGYRPEDLREQFAVL